jgi:D-xylose 1-dehydrogenase
MSDKFAIYPSLADKVVYITGGASGIGEQITRAFAAQGARVGFVDLDVDASAALCAELPGVAHAICDLRDIDALKSAFAALRAQIGPAQVLVNNAARDDRHPFETVTPDYWDERYATNLRHQFFAAQAVHPMMKAAGGGSIVNMGSVSWMVGQGGMPAYTSAKSAVMGLTRGLARDFGPDNIRVNSLAPGWIMTERQKRLWLTPEGEEELMRRQCLKRKLQPEEMARIVLFLASDEASAMTNQTYVADGGWV